MVSRELCCGGILYMKYNNNVLHNRQKRGTTYQQYLGFSLLELMIVVAIIGILSSISVPAYVGYTERSKLSGAVTAVEGLKMQSSEP